MEYLRPGVFVEEMQSGNYPIEGVGTSTAGFIGVAQKGALNKPKLITNWTQFVKHFGSYIKESMLAYAVYGFFLNKGKRCYVTRVATDMAAIASVVLKDRSSSQLDTLRIQALNEGDWGNKLSIDITESEKEPGNLFGLIVKEEGDVVESWLDLSMDENHERYIDKIINKKSYYIQIENLNSASTPPDNRPEEELDLILAGGDDGITFISDRDYMGIAENKTGIYAFDDIDEINTFAIPGISQYGVIQAALDYCKQRGDLGFVIDCPEGEMPQDTKLFREQFDSDYGYYYYPRIVINDPLTGMNKSIAPSGHIMGIYSRNDSERGVHKAPANELVSGAIGLEYNVTDGEQEILNPTGINCIRSFKSRGIRLWGARTISSNPNLRYIHKRRFLMFVEESIAESSQWAVFEPNDPVLWGKIIRSSSAFLKRQWLEGALFGENSEEAFYVKCDEETNPMEVRNAGQVVVEIGVNIVDAAEFVIFRIGQWDGGKEINEL